MNSSTFRDFESKKSKKKNAGKSFGTFCNFFLFAAETIQGQKLYKEILYLRFSILGENEYYVYEDHAG